MTTNILDTIDMRSLGRELQQARVKQGLTQEEAAAIIEVARTTMTAIEKGERRIKADELIKLAHAYGRQVSDFVRSRPQIVSFREQLRGQYQRLGEDEAKLVPYIEIFEELCRNYLELEQITDTPLYRKYPSEYEISGLRIEQAAENVAIEERNRLGLGDGPIPILSGLLEQDVGLRIFYLPLYPSQFSFMYLYDDQPGGCIAINSQHSEERRRWSLAQTYGHFLVYRHKPTLSLEDSYQRLPESERFSDYFARYFLMPTSGFTRRFNDIWRTKKKITPADLCTLAYYFGVSVAAITLRLEDMRLLSPGIWDKLRAGGSKVREAQQQYHLAPIPPQDERLPARYQYLAIDAFDQALITEGQFARFLGVDRVEARHIAEVLRQHTSGVADDATIDLDMSQSLEA